jgi:hypothetical protein
MERAVEVADESKELMREDSALAGACSLAYLDHERVRDAARSAAYSLRINPECIDALTTEGTLKLAAGDVEAAHAVFVRLSMSAQSGVPGAI